jgi:hypothetical protein
VIKGKRLHLDRLCEWEDWESGDLYGVIVYIWLSYGRMGG